MTENRSSRPRIGFIGLGHMGSRMAIRLLEAGYPLDVYNRTGEKATLLARRGAEVARTPRELAASSDFVLSSLADDAALKAVMFGPDGALAGARPGTTFIEMSTVYPRTSRQIFEAAKAKGAEMIDAAVSGSTLQVEQGTLVIFVGGEEDTFEKCRPILEILGKESFYMGPSGMGSTMKLVVNTVLGGGLQIIAEAIALGEKTGLDKGRLIDVLAQTAVVAPAFRPKLDNALREEYPVTFALRLMYKDFGLVLRQAAELVVPMPATAAAQQVCAAEQAKKIEEDYSAIIRFMETQARGLAGD